MNTYTVQLWVTVDADNSEAAEAKLVGIAAQYLRDQSIVASWQVA